LTSCFKKDVCKELEIPAIDQEELNALAAFVAELDPNAIYDERGFYYSIKKEGTTNKPGICSDIYTNYEASNGKGEIYYQSANNSGYMTFDLSDQIYAWRYAFPLIGMGGEITIYVSPKLRAGYDRLKAPFHNVSSIPSDANVVYKLSMIKYN
jgi:FKBP-type peptidyl-prolyl cis-trans isomerase